MTLTHAELGRAWLDLLRADELARAEVTDPRDEWAYVAAQLATAQALVELAAGPFDLADAVVEAPGTPCQELVRRAADTLQGGCPAHDPREHTLAFLAVCDALRAMPAQVSG